MPNLPLGLNHAHIILRHHRTRLNHAHISFVITGSPLPSFHTRCQNGSELHVKTLTLLRKWHPQQPPTCHLCL
ncbi:hypothetical protein E2C01_058694 [Portunus trituberculatus]|uniref:Uncharacterized protein n=1 Tax=Portunus trituberculatus TaxID=210409 RepID=A0A5B7H3W0_PORTR|nr:hypothetical protein [Portunus trituberculatus]